jgi:hypothetical protein
VTPPARGSPEDILERLTAYVDAVSTRPLIDTEPKPGSVTKTETKTP